jgi:hypothetical protein
MGLAATKKAYNGRPSKNPNPDLTRFFEAMNPPPVPAADRPPRFEWDQWERLALERGLAPGHATLGRAVMREAAQHVWCARLKAECGLSDDGRAMLARVLRHPERTAARWEWLLVTDGLRVDPWEHREFYEDSPCWKAMRQRWNLQRAKEARD